MTYSDEFIDFAKSDNILVWQLRSIVSARCLLTDVAATRIAEVERWVHTIAVSELLWMKCLWLSCW
jgi:hypothetical protein